MFELQDIEAIIRKALKKYDTGRLKQIGKDELSNIKRNEIKRMILEMTNNDDNRAKAMLFQLTRADRVKGKAHV